MKNKKVILLFVLFIAMILAIVTTMPTVKAIDDDLSILDIDEEQPTDDLIIDDEDADNEEKTNNEEESNNEEEADNEEEEPVIVSPKDEPLNEDASNDEKLPQTGVAEDTTLFVFITICLASAIYAYIKVRNYRNI